MNSKNLFCNAYFKGIMQSNGIIFPFNLHFFSLVNAALFTDLQCFLVTLDQCLRGRSSAETGIKHCASQKRIWKQIGSSFIVSGKGKTSFREKHFCCRSKVTLHNCRKLWVLMGNYEFWWLYRLAWVVITQKYSGSEY